MRLPLLALLVCLLSGASFYSGRWVEQRRYTSLIRIAAKTPNEMPVTCYCAPGKEDGFMVCKCCAEGQ